MNLEPSANPQGRRRVAALAACSAALAVLAACGGGGYGGGNTNVSNNAPNMPTITTQPANVTVSAGQAASFTVAADGYVPMTFQWSRSGVVINGATMATYTLPAATAADNGATFQVQVTNIYGSATSSAATLTVQ